MTQGNAGSPGTVAYPAGHLPIPYTVLYYIVVRLAVSFCMKSSTLPFIEDKALSCSPRFSIYKTSTAGSPTTPTASSSTRGQSCQEQLEEMERHLFLQRQRAFPTGSGIPITSSSPALPVSHGRPNLVGGICADNTMAGVHTESELSRGVLHTGDSELPAPVPTGALRGYQPCGLHRAHRDAGTPPARQTRERMSDLGPCGSDGGSGSGSGGGSGSLSGRQGLDACDHNDGDVSEAWCAASFPPPHGERRRRRRRCARQPATGGKGKAHSREQRRWSEGAHSSPAPRTPPLPLGGAPVSYTCSSAMLDRDEGARRYYLRRSASQDRATVTAGAFATGREGAAEAVSLAGRRCKGPAVEPSSSEGNPLARASALCEAYFQLLSQR